MEKLCFFFGHRDTPESILPDLERAIETYCLQYDIYDFVIGSHGNFDQLARRALLSVKHRYAKIRLYLLTPYHPSISSVELPPYFEGTLYPAGMETVPPRFAIVKANQFMIQQADAIICYVQHFGNTRTLLDYAYRQAAIRTLSIYNLAAPQ